MANLFLIIKSKQRVLKLFLACLLSVGGSMSTLSAMAISVEGEDIISRNCAQAIELFSQQLQKQQIDFNLEIAQLAEHWLVWGQFSSSQKQFRQILQQFNPDATQAAFLLLPQQHFWLLNLEQCLLWLMVEPLSAHEWRIRFSLPLDAGSSVVLADSPPVTVPNSRARGLTRFFYQYLPLVHQYVEPTSQHSLSIFSWQPKSIRQWQTQWQSLGVDPKEIRDCIQARVCTVFHQQGSLSLLWSHYQDKEYLLLTEQPCEKCYVDR